MPSRELSSATALRKLIRDLPHRLGPSLRWRIGRATLRAPNFTAALKARAPTDARMGDFWFEYSLTSLLRGRENVALVDSMRTVRGARCLDVGSAYGGTPIAFARAGAAEAVGVEYEESLWTLSQALLRDFPCGARLLRGSALDAGFMHALGTFDVITCMDVIEHVADPFALMDVLSKMLRPDGMLVLKIPNKDAISFVRADGHYGLFGLTQLEEPEARAYYESTRATEPYGVGHYLPLERYRDALTQQGMETALVRDTPAHLDDVTLLARRAGALRRDLPALVAGMPTTDEPTRARVANAVGRYLDTLDHALARTRSLGGRAGATDLVQQLVDTYETEFWKLVVRPGRGR